MPRSDETHNRYDNRNIECMEMVYGEGFLAPGGAEEVARILDGIELEHRDVLDVGCGLGGAVVALARDLHARHVTGVDVEPAVLKRARELVAAAGVSAQVCLEQIKPGPLPFDSSSFDVVYLNSVSCHVEQLEEFFAELLRVLCPGGYLVGSEWYIGEDTAAFSTWDEFLRERGLSFYFVTRDAYTETLARTGFESIELIDRTEAIRELTNRELENVCGSLRTRLREALGEDGYADLVHWTNARANVLQRRGAQRGHFRATKAAAPLAHCG